ncbi:MAG: WD40 repeat domain-containing protein [Cyanobacteria bacterium J06632_22]
MQWSIVTDPTQRGPFGTPLPAAYRLNQWAADGTLEATAALAFVSAVQAAAFDMSAQQFVTLGTYGPLRLWGLDGALLDEFEVGDDPDGMALHPEGGVVAIATAGDAPAVTLWTLAGQRLRTLLTLDRNDHIKTLAFGPRGEIVAVGIDEYLDDSVEQLRLLSLDGEQLTPPLVLNQFGHYALAFSPDGSLIAAGDSDGAISVWTRTGERVSQFSLVEHPGRQTIVETFPSGEERITTINNGPRIFSLAFSPDNRLLVSVDSDGTVGLWQVDGTYVGNLWPDDTVSVNDVRFTPDGQALLIGSEKGVHRWWLPSTLTASRHSPVPPAQSLLLDSPFAPEPVGAGIEDPLDRDAELYDESELSPSRPARLSQ